MKYYGDGVLYRGVKDRVGLEIFGVEERRSVDSDEPYDVELPGEIDGIPVVAVAEGAFVDNALMTSIRVPATVKAIGFGAFDPCLYVKPVVVTESGMCFKGNAATRWEAVKETRTSSLEEIVVDDGNPAYKSIDGVLFSKDGEVLIAYPPGRKDERYVVPSGVRRIGLGAFSGSKFLKTVALPRTLESVARDSFYCAFALERILVDHDNQRFRSIGGVLFSKIGDQLVACPNDFSGDYVVPENAIAISEFAFLGCSSLTSVVLSSGARKICSGAFLGCSALRVVEIPKGCLKIDDLAFASCLSLEEIDIPEGVEFLSDFAFWNCVSLRSAKIPSTLKEISFHAFEACSSLTSIAIPEGIAVIKDGAFSNCDALESVSISETVRTVGAFAFYNCPSLAAVFLAEGVVAIGRSAFAQCPALASATLPQSVEKIDDDAFDDDVSFFVYSDSYAEKWCRRNSAEYETLF